MRSAILSSAASIMVAYNQPSGETTPSREDIDVTKRLAEAGKLMGNELLDHLIFGEEKYTSLKEKGYIRGKVNVLLQHRTFRSLHVVAIWHRC